jgi:hypothetical protein
MTEWNIETASSHHAGCSVYDDGACTCGFRSRREQIERSPLAPGEGTWSVFAQKVVRERDDAREEVARLRALQEELLAALSWYVENGDTNGSPDNQSWLEGKARAQAVITKAKSHEE